MASAGRPREAALGSTEADGGTRLGGGGGPRETCGAGGAGTLVAGGDREELAKAVVLGGTDVTAPALAD